MEAPWYVRKWALHRDLEIPIIKDPFRKLAQSFFEKLLGATNSLIHGLWNHIDPGGCQTYVKCDNPSLSTIPGKLTTDATSGAEEDSDSGVDKGNGLKQGFPTRVPREFAKAYENIIRLTGAAHTAMVPLNEKGWESLVYKLNKEGLISDLGKRGLQCSVETIVARIRAILLGIMTESEESDDAEGVGLVDPTPLLVKVQRFQRPEKFLRNFIVSMSKAAEMLELNFSECQVQRTKCTELITIREYFDRLGKQKISTEQRELTMFQDLENDEITVHNLKMFVDFVLHLPGTNASVEREF
uniref:Uncharacterized protein n=1 Tax=Timema cristinae TaxID=61476 RepID=A0A7R9GUG4_TIMCR|nr:unnamed protein product [Timema cristinae]